jgi:hypothetical protein
MIEFITGITELLKKDLTEKLLLSVHIPRNDPQFIRESELVTSKVKTTINNIQLQISTLKFGKGEINYKLFLDKTGSGFLVINHSAPREYSLFFCIENGVYKCYCSLPFAQTEQLTKFIGTIRNPYAMKK